MNDILVTSLLLLANILMVCIIVPKAYEVYNIVKKNNTSITH